MLMIIMARLDECDRDLVSRLFRKYEKRVLKYAKSILGHDMDAEDCVINTFVKVMEYIETYKKSDEKHVECLLFVTCRNEALTLYRKRKRERERVVSMTEYDDGLPEEIEIADPEQNIEQLVVNQYTEELVCRLMDELDPIYRDVLILKFREGMTNRKIAKLLGLTETAVGTRLMRAKRQLIKKGGKELYDLIKQ